MIRIITEDVFWRTRGILIARFIMGGIFLVAAYTKFHDLTATAQYIASANFPIAYQLAWTAALFELSMGFFIITGVFFRGAVLLLGIDVIFLAFGFHGPFLWDNNPYEFRIFINHFAILAGLLYMVAHGPGKTWTLKRMAEE